MPLRQLLQSLLVAAPGLATSVLLAALLAGNLAGQTPELKFFEEQVRPLLADRCFRCHGPKVQKSDLRLDHIAFLREGGTRGPAVDAAKPAASLILKATSYSDPHLQMPPKRKLTPAEQTTLRRWVESGTPWPEEPKPEVRRTQTFDLDGRRAEHWAWQPLTEPTPPTVADPQWRSHPIDRFVHARHESLGVQPAAPADPLTLLRRVTFDLTGLPPTPEAIRAFTADASDTGYAATVDRLLAAPAFGEHWARHWMDLVRYSETLGHEFDYEIPNAWRYRDYLIRAFNADVRYDQFVREHIAGDLLQQPRKHPEQGFNESIIGTAFYWFGDQTHSPVDVRKATADRTDNQIDVLSKTFLGLTVSCARCHDHKFDAISTQDYYSMSGFLKSSRYMQRAIRPQVDHQAVASMRVADADLRQAWAQRIHAEAPNVLHRLHVALAKKHKLPVPDTQLPDVDEAVAKRFAKACEDRGIQRDKHHPLYGLGLLARKAPRPGAKKRRSSGKKPRDAGKALAFDARAAWQKALPKPSAPAPRDRTLVDFRRQGFDEWYREGTAFGTEPIEAPTMVHSDRIPTAAHTGGFANSLARGPLAQGVLHSPRFKLESKYLHILAHGRDGRVRVVLEGFHLIRNPIYGTLHQAVNSVRPRWYTIDLSMWPGQRGYLEVCDQTTHELARNGGYPKDGYVAVQQAVLSDRRTPPALVPDLAATVFPGEAPIRSLAEGVEACIANLHQAADALTAGEVTDSGTRLLNWLWEQRLLVPDKKLQAQRQQLFALHRRAAPPSAFVPAMADGNGEAENIFLRGSHASLGPLAPRQFLTALAGPHQAPLPRASSGRLSLAKQIVATDNPLTYRVFVNRIWHHLFGRGLVSTVDNFGAQGQPPSHPALLDWLTQEFLADGQSLKSTIRRIVLSRTYRMASHGLPASERKDPENQWLHRARVRRLSGEALRDAVLSISGRLDRKAFGPSTPTHLTRFMTGRGRPRSGPRDGAGRRSVYIRVSRNFLSPFFLAFDTPLPAAPMGRRVITNVPAQALALLNDPFIKEQADLWAKQLQHVLKPEDRITTAYLQAFGRPPRPDELARIQSFLSAQEAQPDSTPWPDLCHALLNVKEFAFLR